jgi:hypothetical protein
MECKGMRFRADPTVKVLIPLLPPGSRVFEWSCSNSRFQFPNLKIRQMKPWVPVAHAYNPSYSGGRDWGITVQSQLGQIVCETLSQKKKKSQKRAGGVAQGVGPEFKPQYHNK